MSDNLDRRDMLKVSGGALASSCLQGDVSAASSADVAVSERGAVVAARAPAAAQAGLDLLTQGGNAIDAAVAAALCAAVVEPASCGIAGYGGHMTIGLADGRVTCIDANSAAPRAARPDMFSTNASGQVPGKSNYYGWLASGVPGTLAGLQLALDRYGNKRFADVAAPAIRFAAEGFTINQQLADSIHKAAEHLVNDPASRLLYFRGRQPLQVGDTCRNPQLAVLLETLAERGSADSFYCGDIAHQISAAFQQHGGIVTAEDLAAYQAQEVQPVQMEWAGHFVCSAPLTAGGATTLQALSTLKALDWKSLTSEQEKQHAALESLRLAWQDRFRYFGDPRQVEVPTSRLLSDDYAEQLAIRVRKAVKSRTAIQLELDSYDQTGTIHISAGDAQGNLAALTLTHGGGFGARVTVAGLGLTLGHGVSRFDPRPGHANSIAPGKRPLNNMVPTVVLRAGRPVLAIGGRGGRRIPNALCSALLPFIVDNQSISDSMDARRMHTEGGMRLTLDDVCSDDDVGYFKRLGYEVTRGHVAYLSGVSFDPDRSQLHAALR